MNEIENVPQVAVQIRKSQTRTDAYWILEVAKCPYCAKSHNHGGGSIDHSPALGHRLSHCLRQPGEYELIPAVEGAHGHD